MQAAFDSTVFLQLYQEGKYWATLVAVLWAAFKGFNWVKDIREKDLTGIKSDVNAVNTELNRQTQTIANGFANLQTATTRELQELRSDFRTFYTAPDPMMMPARAAKKKASVAVRSKAKAKPKPKVK